MEKFTHIENIYNVIKYVQKVNGDDNTPKEHRINEPVKFRGTVKLHGCNSGVACKKGELQPQSRNRVLDITNDNLGFAQFVAGEAQVKAIKEIESELRAKEGIDEDTVITLYGEWIGSGIQQGTAINKLIKRQWVLFAVKVGEKYIDALPRLGHRFTYANIFSILDTDLFEITIDFDSVENKKDSIEIANELTQKVEKQCPWGAKWGCEGIGEGIVWIPIGKYWGRSSLYWKSKGDKHRVVKKKLPKSQDPEILNNINEFVEYSVTENRLLQGLDYLREMKYSLEMRSTGIFLKWLSEDIARECRNELIENGNLEWKLVAKAVNRKALEWFKAQMQTI